MTPSHDQNQATAPPRLRPRAVQRPAVDPAAARVFGRPPGVEGGFSVPAGPPADPRLRQGPPPSEALASAFSRPPGTREVLQRPPGAARLDGVPERHLWAADADPWRDPEAAAVLGAPALAEGSPAATREPPGGARLSLREVLFGRRLQPPALALFGAAVLLVGAVGGLVGRLTAEGGGPLTDPDVTLVQVEPAVDRPAGSVAEVADRVLPAVVSIEIRTGDQGGFGSGVVIDGAGFLLTNNHVVSPAAGNPGAMLETVFADGTRVPARIVGRDPKTDLAVLKVEVANPTVAQLGRS
nr:trypsin-like peptidase domain-containing protein [Actinomycetota bacterium]